MATIEPKEKILIQKFRNRVTDVVPQENLRNDYWLIRWLRARDLDLEKAENMLRKSMAWYKRNELDEILGWKPIHNYYRYSVAGTDKDGSPVFILPFGLWDIREVVEAGDVVPGFRAVLRVLSRMEDEIKISEKKLGKPVNQVIAIFDFQQFSYRQLNNRTVVQGAVEFFKIFEANYPEILKHCYFINTPRIFPVFFAIVKPFLTARTMSKMEFFGPQKSKWQRAILQSIPSEILPPGYGGTRSGNDEYCTESMWNDGPLPKDYFGTDMSRGRNSIVNTIFTNGHHHNRRQSSTSARRGSIFENGSTVNFTREEIPAGSKLEIEFPVSKSRFQTSDDDSQQTILLKWKIKSEGYDIGFQVAFKDEEGKHMREELIDTHRIDSHLLQQDGSIVCDKPGIYVVTFDNTYSKRRKKVVYYNIKVEDLHKL